MRSDGTDQRRFHKPSRRGSWWKTTVGKWVKDLDLRRKVTAGHCNVQQTGVPELGKSLKPLHPPPNSGDVVSRFVSWIIEASFPEWWMCRVQLETLFHINLLKAEHFWALRFNLRFWGVCVQRAETSFGFCSLCPQNIRNSAKQEFIKICKRVSFAF